MQNLTTFIYAISIFLFMADNKCNPGDLVNIKTAGEVIQGIMLESTEGEFYLIKLTSGYNIGVRKESVQIIDVIKKAEKTRAEEIKLPNNDLPKIDIIMTGGTISSRIDYKTGGVRSLTEPSDFFKYYPEIFKIANVGRVSTPFMKLSENMVPGDWKKIAEEVEISLNNPEIEGIIITHGTDILHYTAAALSFFFPKPNKPIVLTFSQKSTDRASSDASLNLECAARIAISNMAEVVIVGHATTNDEYCYALLGTKARKMHSTARDAFKPINTMPLLKVWADGKIEKISPFRERPPRGEKSERVRGDIVFNERIAMIKFYPGQSPDVLEYYSKNYEGLIIEGIGVGNVSVEGENNWLPQIKKAMSNGLAIFMTLQTINGRTEPWVYSTARELKKLGVTFLEDMTSETAFVKLGWVLAHKNWKDKISAKMLENISGEVSERIVLTN
jgi:glutamyl-tRNA(Gln) amidotransferase subunit D